MNTGDIPETPAGAQLRWFLDSIAHPETMTAADVIGRYARLWPDSSWHQGDEQGRADWKRHWDEFGEFHVEVVEAESPTQVSVVLSPVTGRKQRILFIVEEEPPHRIRLEKWSRVHDYDLQMVAATEEHAATLADIERRALVVLGGDSTVATDRGDDYFAAARLIDDPTVFLAVVDGDPAGVSWGAQSKVVFDGEECNATYFFHLRVTPEHQGKGLWGAFDNAVWTRYWESADLYIGYWLAENKVWAHVAEQVQARPDFKSREWIPTVYRLLLPVTSVAGPRDGARTATPADADRIVEILNDSHAGEELYHPYTVESLTARLERDPALYSWGDVLLTDRAVMGVWPAGEKIEVVTTKGGEVTRSRRGHVMDYGFLAGGGGEFSDLLAASCAELQRRGIDQLSIFTSKGARGQQELKQFKGAVEAYRFNPGMVARMPESAQNSGIYTDHLYF
ncbi:MAG TPA: hypothetical protein VM143_02225 [Acidimicrobiales bacterium]|nr:hypothetical protein [Acidimicrobiales bacterium]